MNPAMSVVFFTTLAGVGQGVVMAIALSALAGVTLSASLVVSGLAVSLALLLIALGASFLHLGRPGRAWRAVMMWRTSWLSREVIVLPTFIAVVALWLGMHLWQQPGPLRDVALPLVASALCLLLWYCTAMIYACIRFIQEWAHPLTLVNYTLIGLSSGLVLFTALCALNGDAALVRPAAGWALFFTVLAAVARIVAIARNVRLKPKSTLHSAIGVKTAPLRQKSMGMTGGSFNTREFMHGKTLTFLSGIRYFAIGAGFVAPAMLLLPAVLGGGETGPSGWLLLAVLVQSAGVLADRWYFFAQARHPQNLYYQIVS